jgi:rod shape-determining protein MreC
LITENQRQADLLKTKSAFDHKTLTASVIYSDASGAERVITIDKGSDDGVVLNATVVASGGALAGLVQEVGRNYATVRLLNDTRSVVSGRDLSSRATGSIQGNLSAPLDMVNVPATEHLAVGDTVITAGGFGKGYGSQFPKDIVIGRIIEVRKDPASIVISALIQPAADLDSLESVLVITDFVPRPLPGATPAPNLEPSPDPNATPTPTPKPKKTPKR